jgi:hypothetical protein
MPEPRLFFLSLAPRGTPSQELPPGWRGFEADSSFAVEIAPGVRVAPLGTGDFMLPGSVVGRGAGIAVWAESPDTRACRHCGGELVRCDPPHDFPVCRGWKHAARLSMLIGAHYCEGRSVNPSGEPREDEENAQ